MDEVVLVDQDDHPVGVAGKQEVHLAPGHLHRAVSVFLFTARGEVLLQRRAATKYHFAGLWSNSCCTHPRPGESPQQAGERRVAEELGLTCSLRWRGSFVYRAVDPASGLVEHELDHVLVGRVTAEAAPDPAEVDATRVVGLDRLHRDLAADPGRYTPWLAQGLAALGPDPLAGDVGR